jgi:glycosyltransferase involved in cell wall biosynthesis
MHILLIHQAFAAINEAGGTRHHEMARHLVQRGHRVTIIASPVSYLSGKQRQDRRAWLDRQEPEPGITILRAFTYSALHKSFVHRVFSFLSFMISSFLAGLAVKQVDLVWGTSPPIFQGITAWLLARLKGVPFLFEVRDLWPAFAIAIGVLRNPALVRASLWLERFLYRQADRVMVNSPGFIEHVLRRGARWVELVPNGAEPGMFQPDGSGEQFRQDNQLGTAFTVLYAGAHGMSNDLGIVLQTAEQMRSREDIKFILLGDGKEKASLQAQAAAQNLSNLHFLPPVPKERMREALAASDACLAILKPVELYKTTYPNKVFDYMAAGRPVVLAIDGVIRQVVEAAGAGLFADPGSPEALARAVSELASDPQKAREMGLSGRRFIERHFDRRQLAEKLALIVEEMKSTDGGKNSGRRR